MDNTHPNLPGPRGTAGGSPFDRIRREDSDGEWWSARDLQPLMGYLHWEDFSGTVVNRAIRSAENTGTYSDQAFSAFTEKGTGGRGRQDYRLNRQAAYLVGQGAGGPVGTSGASSGLHLAPYTPPLTADPGTRHAPALQV